MHRQDANRITWENEETVSEYSRDARLQIPEALIFLKHKEELWGKRILDIGCGGGRTSLVLTNATESYTGIDYSEAMIRSCRKRLEKGSFLQLDVRDMHAFESEQFDFVLFSYNGLDYVPAEAGRQAGLGEIHRVLKRGRLFVFSSHNRNYERASIEPRFGLSRKPVKQLKNIYRYLNQKRNRRRNKRLESQTEEGAIVNDSSDNHSLLTYYVRKAQQIGQLESAGFEVLEMYDTNGALLGSDSPDEHTPWIYYVARRV